jgi:hypothetical protein
MGIENRKGKLYYYRKKRDGNRVISEYVGGDVISISAYQTEKKQQEREKAERAEAKMSLAEIDAQIDLLSKETDRLVSEWLISQGFHQHKRQWRLKRNGSKTKDQT